MFDSSLVVQSAVSAFNNAALAAPTFFWLGLLSLPLMAMAYLCGNEFMRRIAWRPADIMLNSGNWAVAIMLIWILGFGGNYNAVRDGVTLLPYFMAVVVFVCAVMMGVWSRGRFVFRFSKMSRAGRIRLACIAALVLFFVGASGLHTWWGVAMQIAAFCMGIFIGRRSRRTPNVTPVNVGLMCAIVILILMQPEFFRFGQLGALTIVHMAAILCVGVLCAAVFALRNVMPRGAISRSAYVKLKWLARVSAALGVALFVLTESVPVFVGTLVLFGLMFALSVRHAKCAPAGLDVKLYAITMMLFGVVTTLPVLSALGVLIWINSPKMHVWSDGRFLL